MLKEKERIKPQRIRTQTFFGENGPVHLTARSKVCVCCLTFPYCRLVSVLALSACCNSTQVYL